MVRAVLQRLYHGRHPVPTL